MGERSAEQLDRYLLKGERIVVAVHRHWATVAEPVATSVLLFVVTVWFSIGVSARYGRVADALWWVWFASLARALVMLYEWRREWFMATDRRLLLVYGFLVRKVDMMPLGKVTDMTYHRSIPGRLLGFGTFVLESAGQDQALSRVDFVPHPDRTYRAMIAQIFHRDGDGVEESEADAYETAVAEERDPVKRRSFGRHLARLVPAAPGRGDAEPDDDATTPTTGLRVEDVRAAQARRDDSHAQAPTESLWQNRGESLYSSDSPVQDYRDDTTGWWQR